MSSTRGLGLRELHPGRQVEAQVLDVAHLARIRVHRRQERVRPVRPVDLEMTEVIEARDAVATLDQIVARHTGPDVTLDTTPGLRHRESRDEPWIVPHHAARAVDRVQACAAAPREATTEGGEAMRRPCAAPLHEDSHHAPHRGARADRLVADQVRGLLREVKAVQRVVRRVRDLRVGAVRVARVVRVVVKVARFRSATLWRARGRPVPTIGRRGFTICGRVRLFNLITRAESRAEVEVDCFSQDWNEDSVLPAHNPTTRFLGVRTILTTDFCCHPNRKHS